MPSRMISSPTRWVLRMMARRSPTFSPVICAKRWTPAEAPGGAGGDDPSAADIFAGHLDLVADQDRFLDRALFLQGAQFVFTVAWGDLSCFLVFLVKVGLLAQDEPELQPSALLDDPLDGIEGGCLLARELDEDVAVALDLEPAFPQAVGVNATLDDLLDLFGVDLFATLAGEGWDGIDQFGAAAQVEAQVQPARDDQEDPLLAPPCGVEVFRGQFALDPVVERGREPDPSVDHRRRCAGGDQVGVSALEQEPVEALDLILGEPLAVVGQERRGLVAEGDVLERLLVVELAVGDDAVECVADGLRPRCLTHEAPHVLWQEFPDAVAWAGVFGLGLRDQAGTERRPVEDVLHPQQRAPRGVSRQVGRERRLEGQAVHQLHLVLWHGLAVEFHEVGGLGRERDAAEGLRLEELAAAHQGVECGEDFLFPLGGQSLALGGIGQVGADAFGQERPDARAGRGLSRVGLGLDSGRQCLPILDVASTQVGGTVGQDLPLLGYHPPLLVVGVLDHPDGVRGVAEGEENGEREERDGDDERDAPDEVLGLAGDAVYEPLPESGHAGFLRASIACPCRASRRLSRPRGPRRPCSG